jgi:hypothetical protein
MNIWNTSFQDFKRGKNVLTRQGDFIGKRFLTGFVCLAKLPNLVACENKLTNGLAL